MNELTFADIFIGENGIVVLVSAMLLALAANLLKKYQRYQQRKDKTPFSFKHWFNDNWDDMTAGFFVTYIFVRLMNVVSGYALEFLNLKGEDLQIGEVIVVVSCFIGYFVDSILDKIVKKELD
tara:strand:+ start:76 stop:444 length:369 start_codon:yes stop_codon:yes gene_type:complete